MKTFRNRTLGFLLGVMLIPLLAMAADVKISDLPAGTTLGGTEAMPAVQSGSTVKTTPGALSTYTIGSLTSANVISKWTGTCSSSTFLRGDGACQAAGGGGSGTVTSVGMTVPSWLTVSGSPITTTGTLAVTTATGQTANRVLASPDGTTGAVTLRALLAADLPAIPLTTGVTGILPSANGGTNNAFFTISGPSLSTKTFTFPNNNATVLTSASAVTVPQGGTGVATLTGLVLGNGASAMSAAASSNVISLWTGTCNSGTYLRADGSCAAPSGSGTVTSVGLTMPGIFSVANSPVTSNATLAVTATGTSGGVPYFSGSTTLASSAALTSHGVVIGGGTGTAPTSTTAGTAGQILTSNGASADPTFQSGVGVDALPASAGVSAGDLFLVYDIGDVESQQATTTQVATAVLGNAFLTFAGPTTSTKTITFPNASTTVAGLTDTQTLTNKTINGSSNTITNVSLTAGVTGTLPVGNGGLGIASGTSGGVPYYSGSTTIASSGALTANALVVGGGAGVAPSTTATINNGSVVIRINPRVQVAADATSVTPTGDTADQTTQANTQTAGTLTMNAPTGTPVQGQKWIFRIKSTNIQTFSWNAIFRGSTAGALPTASSGSSLTDYFGFIYNSTDTKWDYVSGVKGF